MIQIARDLGFEVVERDIARGELYQADEVFLTGTAAEIVPVREIDDTSSARPGRSRASPEGLRRRDARPRPAYPEWLDVVPVPSRA